ncbi:hypothetical protein F5Y11DRAFT_330310 [Daldinia sp. FL1419]|nr:hypothetical protein F5Y11DRAFT_330310 [Daldinia sp. FL1419]
MPPHLRSASKRTNAGNQSAESAGDGRAQASKTAATRGRKRKSTESQSSGRSKRGKQADASNAPNAQETEEVPEEQRKPRLTTPDLEFDYDRSQLRDPRPTPGRVKRPRWEAFDLPQDIKERFYIPEPKKPKGRLNALEKDRLFKKKALMDPSETFHDLYVCHKKGPKGSPTYDSAGFQLDWKKVDDWMRPRAYNKGSIVNGMTKRIEKEMREKREMFDIFFVDGKPPDAELSTDVLEYLRDHVSKDLGVPWHQIGPKHLAEWAEKGFQKQKAEEWWREPNEMERLRMSKMESGCELRKDL